MVTILLVVASFVAGLLVGRKNPTVAAAAAKIAADTEAKAKAKFSSLGK